MKTHSIQQRMLLMTLVVIVVFMSITASALRFAYRESLYSAQEAYLTSQVYSLLATAELDDGQLYFPERVGEPKLNDLSSDLFAYVTQDDSLIWRSESAAKIAITPHTPNSDNGTIHFQVTNDQSSATINTLWVDDNDQEFAFTFHVKQTLAALNQEIAAFEGLLGKGLGGAGAVLLLGIFLALRLGLRPLQQLADEVKAVEEGKQTHLNHHYPLELQSTARNLNHLIDTEEQQRERYRHTLADLAHSLKTPLAVLKNTASAQQNTDLDAPIQRMDEIISHQLKRATKSYQQQSYQGVAIRPHIERIVTPLQRIYPHACNLTIECEHDTLFKGDEGDLLELLGNSIENAFKYNDGDIQIHCVQPTDAPLSIKIMNTCLPLSETALAQLQTRGQRADTHTSGQGIGLAVIADIVTAYGGKLAITQTEDETQTWFCIEMVF